MSIRRGLRPPARRPLEAAKSITFADCAERFIKAHEAGWKNEKHVAQWQNTLETYCSSVVGAVPVQNVDTGLVLKVLEPIWTKNPETASRMRVAKVLRQRETGRSRRSAQAQSNAITGSALDCCHGRSHGVPERTDMTELKLSLLDHLANQAKAAGLLTSEAIERPIREAIRRAF